jgi:membrane-bound lytic murein transglycosylase D
MHRMTALSAVWALILSFVVPSLAFAQNQAADEINAEPEIVNLWELKLVPQPAQRSNALLPRPHLPLHDGQSDIGSAHLLLGDIPFSTHPNSQHATASLWERIRGTFRMRDLPSPLVKDWENWYASRPDYLARMIERSERYLFFVVEEIEKRGMPSEIALLPMIESAYNPKAYSSAHASGMWQFIPSTGKHYGLKQNWWQDERRDVLAATRAALDYLEKLYEMFGSWELALASYNWGEGAVGRAIQRNEARGLPTDYLSLDMPAETRNYIPKLMAVKNLIARPENYGVKLAEIPNQPYFTVVHTDKHIDVKLAARFADMPVADFIALNPSHNRPVIRADGTQPILLPTDRADRFQTNLEAHGSRLTSWQSYTIDRNDRLERIADRFGIALNQLREVNSIPARLRSLVGMTILVPNNSESPASTTDLTAAGFSASAVAAAAAQPVVAMATSMARHIVKYGETLSAIAQRYRVTPSQLASHNGIRNGRVRAGQSLTIPGASSRSEPQPNAKLADARPVAKAAQAADPKSKVARTQPPKANNKKPVKAQTPNAAARSNGSKPQTASSRTQVASAGGRN